MKSVKHNIQTQVKAEIQQQVWVQVRHRVWRQFLNTVRIPIGQRVWHEIGAQVQSHL